jgi:hypothetical protein
MGTKKGMVRKTSRKAYMQEGGGFTYGAGDGDITPQKANMESMAKGGGLMGFTNGGGVMDGMMDKKMAYGGNAGDLSRSARKDYSK